MQLELARDIDSCVEGNANLMNRTLEQCCLITHVAGIFRSRNSIENSCKIYNAIYFHLYTRLEYLGGDCDEGERGRERVCFALGHLANPVSVPGSFVWTRLWNMSYVSTLFNINAGYALHYVADIYAASCAHTTLSARGGLIFIIHRDLPRQEV